MQVFFLCSVITLLVALEALEVISTDAGIIALSIIIGAILVSSTIEKQMSAFISTIKEQMETRQNNDSKDKDDSKRK